MPTLHLLDLQVRHCPTRKVAPRRNVPPERSRIALLEPTGNSSRLCRGLVVGRRSLCFWSRTGFHHGEQCGRDTDRRSDDRVRVGRGLRSVRTRLRCIRRHHGSGHVAFVHGYATRCSPRDLDSASCSTGDACSGSRSLRQPDRRLDEDRFGCLRAARSVAHVDLT